VTTQDFRTTFADQDLDLLDLIPAPRKVKPAVQEPVTGPHGGPLRVLAIGINFGPEHTGIAPYTTQLCEYLAERGASVSVFTGVPHYPSWTVTPQDKWRLCRTETRQNLRVRRLRHYVPKTQSAIRRAMYELTFALQVAVQRSAEPPDVVLAVVPSLLSAVVAQRIAARMGVPLVVWVQDLMGQAAAQSGMDGGDRVAGVVASIEKYVLRRADQVLVLNAHFADHVRTTGVDPGRIAVRPNWTHIAAPSGADRRQVRARLGWQPDETIVLHSGNMGLKQDLGNVIAAARLADQRPDNKIRFVLMGDGSQRRALQQEAEGVATVQFVPPAGCEDYGDVLAATDILLVNERASSVDMSLPSKLTSYFRAGRPVIAASPVRGGTAAEVERSGAGLVVTPADPRSLLDAVVGLLSHPETASLMGLNGSLYASKRLDSRLAVQELIGTVQLVTRKASASSAASSSRISKHSTTSREACHEHGH
jgi:glycosyltransferase involved in cell wall biosynthesis